MTEQTDAAEVETLVRLFVSHQRIPTYEGLGHRCVGCDHLAGETDGSNSPRVAKHIAELLLASDWLAAREAAARAEALREAADAWTQGAWSDVMLPKPTPPAVPVIAYSNRMGDWLRDRADSIARTDGAGS